MAPRTDTGTHAFLRQLVTDGIRCIFGNPGSSEENVLEVLRDPEFETLTYYLGFHEGSVVAMADAYARAAAPHQGSNDLAPSRRPAVVQLHSYAGLANGLGMMYAARRGYAPLVVFAGEAGLRYDAMNGQMAADLCDIARPFVKSDANGPCAWRVVDASSVVRLLRRAIKTASTPPMGPVFLALPMDILAQPNKEIIEPTGSVYSRVLPDPAVVRRAAEILAAAERPLILMGDGVGASGAQAALAAVAERAGAVVWGANSSEVNLPASHPLFGGVLGHMFGEDSRAVTSNADAVLICGTTVLPEVFPLVEGTFAPGAHIIHFDLNTAEIGKNFPTAIGGLADPREALNLVATALTEMMSEPARARARRRIEEHANARDSARRKALSQDEAARDNKPLKASRFMAELGERLTAQRRPVIVFDEALTHSAELSRYVPQETPGTYFQTRAGMLGTGLPGALGVKVARPDHLVFGFSGDGGSMSTIQALATAARHRIGAKLVVCNNQSYRILKYNLRQYRQELGVSAEAPFPPAFDLAAPRLRFDRLAEAQGVPAVRVERADEIGSALDRAFQDDDPFLIDLVLDPAL